MAARPNILVITSDQQRWDTLGCYGNPHVKTPVLDELARRGVRFEYCYAPNPVCAPTRASMYTGRYPQAHRLYANGQDLPDDEVLFTRLLADAGYDCGLIGKLHLGACHRGRVEPRRDDGYRVYEWAHHPGDDWGDANAWWRWLKQQPPAPERPEPPYPIAFGGVGEPVERHFSHWAADRTIEFIRTARRPFFAWMSLFDPHFPFDPPLEYLQMYDPSQVPPPKYRPGELDSKPWYHKAGHLKTWRNAKGFVEFSEEELRGMVAAYWAMCSHIDYEVGRVLEALEDLGLADSTLVIYTSDHGDMLGDHGLLWKGPYFYEGAVRVPLLMRWPGELPEGYVASDGFANLVHFAPTILEAAGVEVPAFMQGRSLLPAARGRAWALPQQTISIWRESFLPGNPPIYATMLRTMRYKLVVNHFGMDGELYDLREDPDEFENRWDWADYRAVRERLLLAMMDELVRAEPPGGEYFGDW